MQYTVVKQHYGDRQYFEGEQRIVENAVDAKRLIDAGLIAESDAPKKASAKKAAPKARNKAAPEHENKAE